MFIVVQRTRIWYANIRTDFVAIVMFFSSVVMLARGKLGGDGSRFNGNNFFFRLVFPSFFLLTYFFA